MLSTENHQEMEFALFEMFRREIQPKKTHQELGKRFRQRADGEGEKQLVY